MKKWQKILTVFLVLAFLGWILQILGLAPKTETPQVPTQTTTTEQSSTSKSSTTETTEKSSTSESSAAEETEPSSETVAYDVAAMNVKITDSFNESVQFNQEGHDGYEWSAHIYELKLKENGAINATVNDSFSILSDAEKTEVLNSVSRAVNMVVFIETGEDKSYFITAYDTSGNKVAQSRMTNVLKYKFK